MFAQKHSRVDPPQPLVFRTGKINRAQLALDRAIETRSAALRALALARTGTELPQVETAPESWFSAIED
jgi:hypothetical protein